MGLNKRLIDQAGGAAGVVNTDNFAPVLYTGNSTNDQSITGVGFQPDFVWIKSRNTGTGTSYHGLWDSVRGTGGHLYSSLTNAETNTPNRLYSFDSDGFSLGNGVDPEYIGNNNYVAWCWKGGGSAVSNTDGSITSTVSANQAAGFSIVKYNSGTTAITAGHGLSQKPEMLICKPLVAGSWAIWHKDFADLEQTYIPFTSSAAIDTGLNIWNYSNWGDNLIGSVNPTMFGNSNDVIAYCFHSVDGYQKVGSYTGNTSGVTVTTGFKPRFLMIKRTDSTGNWFIYDSVRSGGDTFDDFLHPNLSAAETTNNSTYEFNATSTGFNVVGTGDGQTNSSGGTHIYLAIA